MGKFAAVKEIGQQRPHAQRHEHTAERNDKARFAGFTQLMDIGTHAGGKHNHNHAELRELIEHVRRLEHPQDSRSQHKPGQQRAHHLGHLKAPGNQAENFGADQNQRDMPEIIIAHRALPLRSERTQPDAIRQGPLSPVTLL